jgi:hypothetical protein
VRAQPPGAKLVVDGQPQAGDFWSARLPRDGTVHELRVYLEGHVPARILFVDAPPPLDVTLEPLPAPSPPEPAGEPEAAAAELDAPASPRPAASEREVRSPVRRRAPRAASPPAAERSPDAAQARKRKPFVQIIGDGASNAARDRGL